FFGALPREKDALGILQGHGPHQFLLVVLLLHHPPPSISAASTVPSTRARIFSNAVSRVVEVSSQKGENPQSSVVPSCPTGMYSAASRTRSRTSPGVSMSGWIAGTTPTKIPLPGRKHS